LPRGWGIVIAVPAIAMAMFHLYETQEIITTPWRFQNIHLLFALLLVFLVNLREKGKLWLWPWTIALVIATLVGTLYIHYAEPDLQLRLGRPTTTDIVIGFMLVLLVLEAIRQVYGWILPSICLIFILYEFFGHHISGSFGHPEIPTKTIASHLALGYSGIYGQALSASANMVFYFMLFGGLMQASGATRFFVEIGSLLSKRVRSGAALSAVTGSASVGMITGSPMANVGITGSFTIPAMKKAGYTAEQAAGIEAAASTGGQIMPPIMGAAAFIMASMMGVPYIDVVKMAIIPSVLFFLSIGIYAHLQAHKLNIHYEHQSADISALIKGGPIFIISLAVLVWLMVQGHTPAYSAFWTIVVMVGLSLVITRPSLGEWINGFTKGSVAGAKVAVAISAVGIIMAVTEFTGLGMELPGLIEGWTAGFLPAVLILTAFASIILGSALHTVVAYLLVALLLAPVMMDLGVELKRAHFFAQYWAVFANLTPPVALSALAAAGLAGSAFMKTVAEGAKAGMAAFIVPFLIIYNPVMLGDFEDPLWGVLSIISVILAIFCLLGSIIGQYMTRLDRVDRGLLLVDGILFLSFGFDDIYVLFAAGVGLFSLISVRQVRKRRKSASGEQISAT